MKLYKIVGVWIDLFIIAFVLGIIGEILTVFVNGSDLYDSPITFMIIFIITIPVIIIFFSMLKNDNTIGKRISKKIFKTNQW